jgi:hypothetical protein
MPDEPSGLPPPPDWNAAQPVIPNQPPGFPPQPGFPQQAGPYGYYPQPQAYAAGQPGNGIGIAGGVCGIVAVVLCWIPFVDYVSIVLGALAIIFGALGLRNANAHGGAGKGMAITGIVTGIVALVISVLFLAVVYTAVTSINTSVGVFGG